MIPEGKEGNKVSPAKTQAFSHKTISKMQQRKRDLKQPNNLINVRTQKLEFEETEESRIYEANFRKERIMQRKISRNL